MKIIIIKERVVRKKLPPIESALLVEDNGSPDGGRIVARITRYEEAIAVCRAMGWEVTDDEFVSEGD